MKIQLRVAAKAALHAAHADAGEGAAALMATMFLRSVPWRRGSIVSGYAPLADEPDPLPLLDLLAARGLVTALPTIQTPAAPLVFRRWGPGGVLVPGRGGTREPSADSEIVRPDLLIIPVLAFDRQGGRLGRGGGYFDRTLAALRAESPVLAVGFAYAAQEIAAVPFEAHDTRLDWIVTQSEAIRAGHR